MCAATLGVGGEADTKIWLPNCFLIMSIMIAEANRWTKKKGGISSFWRKRRERDWGEVGWGFGERNTNTM